ncbi:MAG: TldD/PmbA family protein [Candidatus Wallbacteria bacterium]|nr:TldD/PmbA family protein [Candidatus Wallbacteria bacterium]
MLRKLKSILQLTTADYADIRYEVRTDTSIAYNCRELTGIGSNSCDGFVIRVLNQGGFATIAFTKPSDALKALKQAEVNALLASKHKEKPVRIGNPQINKGQFLPVLSIDPRTVSLEEKQALTLKYNEIALKHPKIVNTVVSYDEVVREKYFISSEGAEIREDLVTTRIGGMITAKDGNLLQNVRVNTGGSTGFEILLGAEAAFEKKREIAVALLSAKPLKSGTYNVILNPSMSGVFTHEAFGHFSEADCIEGSPSMRAKMKLGSLLGSEILNIKDNPTLRGALGYYRWDDEGVEARPAQLLKKGVLVGRLHSRRTAEEFGEPVSGHCVAEDYRFAPIIRMGTIFIEPGKDDLESMLSQLGDGLYILDAKGGQTNGENFTFGAQYGYLIKNGKIGEMIRDINITGNLYQTMKNISAVGSDFELTKSGGCGKGQTNIRSCYGGPHIIIRNVVVGGAA